MDVRTISEYFIGYPEKYNGYRFYCPTHSTRIVETGNYWFFENGETSGSKASHKVNIKEVKVQVPLTCAPTSRLVVSYVAESHDNKEEQQIIDPMINNEPMIK